MESEKQSIKFEGLKGLRTLVPPLPWHRPYLRGEDAGEVVVLIHGLWRSQAAMKPMEEYLLASGYAVLNFTYPSFRAGLDEMTERLHEAIERQTGGFDRVHFVTHSLGGVVLRTYVDQADLSGLSRAVMLAPPHRGSEVVDWLQGSVVRKVLGPAGEFLSSESMAALPSVLPSPLETSVVMGKRAKVPFLHHLLDSDNDGIVSVNSGIIPGIDHFKVVDCDHSFIACDREVMRHAQEFLRHGCAGIRAQDGC